MHTRRKLDLIAQRFGVRYMEDISGYTYFSSKDRLPEGLVEFLRGNGFKPMVNISGANREYVHVFYPVEGKLPEEFFVGLFREGE